MDFFIIILIVFEYQLIKVNETLWMTVYRPYLILSYILLIPHRSRQADTRDLENTIKQPTKMKNNLLRLVLSDYRA